MNADKKRTDSTEPSPVRKRSKMPDIARLRLDDVIPREPCADVELSSGKWLRSWRQACEQAAPCDEVTELLQALNDLIAAIRARRMALFNEQHAKENAEYAQRLGVEGDGGVAEAREFVLMRSKEMVERRAVVQTLLMRPLSVPPPTFRVDRNNASDML